MKGYKETMAFYSLLMCVCYTLELLSHAFPSNFSNNKREGDVLVSVIEPPPSNYVALHDPS